MIADGSVDQIRQYVGQSLVRFRGPSPGSLPGIARIEEAGGWVTIYAHDADEVVRSLVGAGLPFSDLEVRRASLEEAFVEITKNPTP
jgi:ABC-2 type transport system ATP-binding protein